MMLEDKLGDPVYVMRLRLIGAVLGIGGAVHVVALVGHIWSGWLLAPSDPVALSMAVESDPWFGAQYGIMVNGERYSCSGGHTKLAKRADVVVRYDADNPSTCRAADVVRSLGSYEMAGLLGGVAFVLFGVGAFFLWVRPRARLVCFVGAAGLVMASFVFYVLATA